MITNRKILGNIESPYQMQIFDSDDIICRGWFYSFDGIKSIEIFIDGITIGTAMQWEKRIDLKLAYPQYNNIENAGFIFYRNVHLDNGKHKISFRIESKNYEISYETRDIIVNKAICVIKRINIELTNHCNLNCLWCAGSGKREKGFMNFNLFTKIFTNLLSPNIVIDEIHLYNVGESLLHPEFCRIIEYIGKIKKKPKIVLVTNATLLTDSINECLIKSDGINRIQFSIDGGTKESFEWLRRGARWDDIIKKINCFLDTNQKGVETGLITIDTGVPFCDDFISILSRVDSFDFRPPHDWTGQEKLEEFIGDKIFNPHPCWHIQNNLVFLWNGDVTVCCADLHGRGIIGNIYTSSIEDLWKGKRLTLFRKQISGEKKEIDLCKNCSIL